jgi:hypothetical protein
MVSKTLPYETSTAKDALGELQKVLSKFGCAAFGTMTDVEHGETVVQFRWHDRHISLRASWKGYAEAWMRIHPYKWSSRRTKQDWQDEALRIAQKAVGSVLRDWVKGQVTAIECGVMSFEAAFMPHVLLPTGERVIDRLQAQGGLLQLENKHG